MGDRGYDSPMKPMRILPRAAVLIVVAAIIAAPLLVRAHATIHVLQASDCDACWLASSMVSDAPEPAAVLPLTVVRAAVAAFRLRPEWRPPLRAALGRGPPRVVGDFERFRISRTQPTIPHREGISPDHL